MSLGKAILLGFLSVVDSKIISIHDDNNMEIAKLDIRMEKKVELFFTENQGAYFSAYDPSSQLWGEPQPIPSTQTSGHALVSSSPNSLVQYGLNSATLPPSNPGAYFWSAPPQTSVEEWNSKSQNSNGLLVPHEQVILNANSGKKGKDDKDKTKSKKDKSKDSSSEDDNSADLLFPVSVLCAILVGYVVM